MAILQIKVIIGVFFFLQIVSSQDNLRQLSNIEEVTNMTQLTEIFKNNRVVVMDFYATWCGPCQSMKPYYDKYAITYTKGKYLSVNVDVADDVVDWAKIEMMPTFKVFVDEIEVGTIVGADPEGLEKLLIAYAQ